MAKRPSIEIKSIDVFHLLVPRLIIPIYIYMGNSSEGEKKIFIDIYIYG